MCDIVPQKKAFVPAITAIALCATLLSAPAHADLRPEPVPGGVAAAAGVNGRHRNGGAHRTDDSVGFEVASTAEPDSGIFAVFPPRDPEAVRASMSSHFGGVHAGRSHARETRGTDSE